MLNGKAAAAAAVMFLFEASLTSLKELGMIKSPNLICDCNVTAGRTLFRLRIRKLLGMRLSCNLANVCTRNL